MLYDEKCLVLAEQFLSDIDGSTEKHADLLAGAIQTAIEDWIEHDFKALMENENA